MKIKGVMSGELDIKRCYLPDITIEYTCPSCGTEDLKDFNDEYLSYPKVGKDFTHTLWCNKCDHEWPVNLKLDIKLKIAKENV